MMNRIVVTASVANITGRPRLFHNFTVMGLRVRSDNEATTMLAVEPMMVPLPPRPAPNANAHQNAPTLIPVAARLWITGINATVIGILSRKADRKATIQSRSTQKRRGCCWASPDKL